MDILRGFEWSEKTRIKVRKQEEKTLEITET